MEPKAEEKKEDTPPKAGSGICHLDIPADDLQRAKKFFEETFGWTVTQVCIFFLLLISLSDDV